MTFLFETRSTVIGKKIRRNPGRDAAMMITGEIPSSWDDSGSRPLLLGKLRNVHEADFLHAVALR
jgi:hypothetical protein